MESTWRTNKPGTGAPWHIVAWPDPAHERNLWSIDIPYGLSLITTRSFTGRIQGLSAFPPGLRPPIWPVFYAFRIMIAGGSYSFALALWTAWLWWRKKLAIDSLSSRKGLLLAWMAALPFNYAAMEAGWVTREVGRQPYIVYGVMKTADAATPLPAATAAASLLVFAFVYLMLFVAFIVLAAAVIRRGPVYEGTAGEGP